MSDRRMFAKTIIDSDAFLDMPLTTQVLYFHLCMRADDDGFVNNAKKIQRMIGCSDDDLKLLFAKSFVIPFESGIIVIKHWRIHNWIRSDRRKDTVYPDEMSKLIVKKNGAYSLKNEPLLQDGSQVVASCQPDDNQSSDICQPTASQATVDCLPNDSVGKDSIVKDSIVKDKDIEEPGDNVSEPSDEGSEIKDKPKKKKETAPPEPAVVQIELIDGTMYDVTQSEIDYWSKMYPAVNVPQEMRSISAWNHSNPKKRKTRGGIKRHINTWMEGKQNRSRTVYNNGSGYVPVPESIPADYDENPFTR